MRIAALLAGLILFPASHLFAGPVVFLEFLNSDVTFGTLSPDQTGYDLSALQVDGTAADVGWYFGGYEAIDAVFDHQSLLTNGSGDVTGSQYFYTGGTLAITLFLEKDGASYNGAFVAPIETLVITAGEGDGGLAFAAYVLGPGLFDEPIAAALGVGRRTTGGQGFSRLLLTDHGNRAGVAGTHTTPERQAWDGVNDITLEVPEPAMLALFTTAAALAVRRRPRR
jgi:hypothetical protein